MKITDFDGENIDKVVSLIRGAVIWLSNMNTKSGNNALPDDFAETLLKVFQTSSVPSFNALFEHFSIQTELSSFTNQGSTGPTIDQVLKFAENCYRCLCSTNKWTGVKTKANKTSFKACLLANKGEAICFNCGGNHILKECTKPLNSDRIKANKKIFWEERKKKKDQGIKPKDSNKAPKKDPKWAPPTAEEKKNQNRRIIDGKEYFYHHKDKRWKPLRQSSTSTPTPPVSTPTGNLAAPQPAATPNADALPNAKEVALINATRQMESVFWGLLGQF